MNNLKNYILAIALAGSLYLGTAQVSLGAPSFTNGQFTSFSRTAGTDTGVGGGVTDVGSTTYTGDTLTDWSNESYTFVYRSPNIGDETVTGSGGNFSLWGPATGSNNGLTAPPGGGNIIVDDGAYEVGPLSQAITGLATGQSYRVTFEWAAGQQSGPYTTATTESWSVALGAATGVYTQGTGDTSGTLKGSQTTGTYYNKAEGFSGWMTQSYDFTASATTDTLYFFANGTPTGQPPFLLLADVTFSTTPVPEPKAAAFWTILFGMLIMVGNRAWRQYQKRSSTNT